MKRSKKSKPTILFMGLNKEWFEKEISKDEKDNIVKTIELLCAMFNLSIMINMETKIKTDYGKATITNDPNNETKAAIWPRFSDGIITLNNFRNP